MTMNRRLFALALSLLYLIGLTACQNDAVETASTGADPEEAAADSAEAAAATTTAFGGKRHAIPGRIEAENYDEGEPGVAYHDLDEKNHGADYRGVTQVDIEPRTDASGNHGIGWTKAGEWVTYSVVVQESGTYDVSFPVGSGGPGGTFHLEFDGQDVTGPIEVPDTGSFHTLKTIKKEGVELEAGEYLMKMVMDADGETGWVMDVDYIEFEKKSL
ncbi:MAG: hypothetical protein DWQ42_22330 [Planctomycetota bacterium]|nr:MAG: hypothetical protein DWQ42_22330 [Planctomycetota bacterium]REK39814.1 MAG: hypothetical protein DWQ46_17400 [Planctomycetota bacterium]